MTELYFHEDDQEMADIDLLVNYVAYPGHTWDIAEAQVWSPADEKKGFIASTIQFDDIVEYLNIALPKFDTIRTGYGNGSWLVDETIGFGIDSSFAILIEGVSDGPVERIWLIVADMEDREIEATKYLFRFLDRFGEFLFTDNHWSFQCKTTELELFDKYCDDKF